MRARLRRFIVGAVCVSIGAVFCGIGGVSPAGAGTVELKFLHKWPEPERIPYFQAVVKEFETANPNIKISMEAVADEPMKDKLRVMMGGSVPDIFFSWSGEFAKKFVRAGAAMDLTPYFREDPDLKGRFAPSLVTPTTFDGKIYGVPFRFSAKFFVYNKEIFAKSKLQPPKTWNDLMGACQTLKGAGVTAIALGNQAPWASAHYLTTLNQKIVPEDVRDRDYEPKTGEFKDPGYVKALEALKTLNERCFNPNVNTTSHEMSRQMFYAGKVGIIYDELPNFLRRYEANIPGKWDFFGFPDISDGKGKKNLITGAPDVFLVSAKTKYPKEALAFLKFLTNKANAGRLVKELGFPSPVIGGTNEQTAIPQIIEAMKMVEKADGLAEWLDTAMEARVVDVYLGNLQQLLGNTKTPAQIMKEVQEVAERVKKEM